MTATTTAAAIGTGETVASRKSLCRCVHVGRTHIDCSCHNRSATCEHCGTFDCDYRFKFNFETCEYLAETANCTCNGCAACFADPEKFAWYVASTTAIQATIWPYKQPRMFLEWL